MPPAPNDERVVKTINAIAVLYLDVMRGSNSNPGESWLRSMHELTLNQHRLTFEEFDREVRHELRNLHQKYGLRRLY